MNELRWLLVIGTLPFGVIGSCARIPCLLHQEFPTALDQRLRSQLSALDLCHGLLLLVDRFFALTGGIHRHILFL